MGQRKKQHWIPKSESDPSPDAPELSLEGSYESDEGKDTSWSSFLALAA